MNDVRDLEPAEMAGVEGGFFVADGDCGTSVPGVAAPTPPWPAVTVSLTNVRPSGLAAGRTIGPGL
jgi:hypothetical protein